jgi:hypothetical protein
MYAAAEAMVLTIPIRLPTDTILNSGKHATSVDVIIIFCYPNLSEFSAEKR